MASTARGRPSRRAASRRTSYIDEVSEDDLGNVTPTPSHSNVDDDEQNEYTPVAQKPIPRRGGRRKASEAPSQPPKRSTRGGRRARTVEPTPQPEEQEDHEDPSTVAETVEQRNDEEDGEATILAAQEEPESPSEKVHAAQKRKRAASSRKSRDSATPAAELSSLPTPSPSASPEASSRSHREFNSPLSDITHSAVNKSPAPASSDAEEQKSQISIINSQSTNLEKPMDIVLKSRSLGIPVAEEVKAPRARMVITHLVLTNFKSYAGKQVVGPFHVSFSSVVGPNGSGKSNVIDSLLFVFGFRASKMRQGKISALIHNSARFPDLSFCEVEVHFQEIMDLPGGAHKVVPDSQLVVSRRAFKNNSSKYYMNKKETNFTTVTTFLKDRGIDLDHKRFLILQGEVESIAQMKPKAGNEHEDGLLEYLEDIIGTSKYKTPIEEAATEVETLNDVCVEKNNRVQHVEKEKTALEDKKNKALAYIRDENDLTMKQSALYQVYIAECENNTKVTEEAIMQMQELLNMELEKHEGNESGIKEIEKAYKRAAKEYESMEKATQSMIKEMAKYDKETVKFEEKRKFLTGKQKKLEKSLQTSRLALSECSSLVEKHDSDIEKKSAEIAQLEDEMKAEELELASIRESLKGKTQGLSDQIAAKQKSLEPWNAKINDKLSAIAVAQSELDILNERGNAGAKALEEAQVRIAAIKENLAEKEAALEEKHQEKTQLEAEVESLKKDINKLSQKEPELRSYVSNARQKAEEARASLASTQNKGSVLSGLMRLKESGRIDGFHGRLGNLGTIEEKYDVAISTACPQLENMVVDTVESGQQCIDYLRKNNLGRANFILLDRLPKRDMSTIFTPENVPRLFDLVKPKEAKFAPAFYSVLQNTLVAKDLEQANRIAYGAKRWRVVTLDGQLIDLSGTMSGGGTRVARGGMSSKQVAETSKEQVSKLEYDRDELEKKLQLFQDKQRQLEASLRQKSDDIPRLDTKIQKIGIEIESGKRSLADAQRRIKELSVEHTPSKADEQRANSLNQQIEALQEEVERLRQDMAGIEEEIQSLQARIMEVGGVRLRSQKAKVDGLKAQINLLSEEISNSEVAKSKNEKLIKKHEKSRLEAEKESEQLSVEIERLDEDVQNQANDASGSRQKAEDAQEALETKRGELRALKQELDEKTAELNETRAQEIEMRNKLEENQKVLAENQKRSRYWEEKLSKLSLQNVSDLGDDQETAQLQTFTDDELADMNKESLKAVIAALEEKTQNASVDLSVIEEYRRRVAEHETRSADLNESLAARDAAKARLDGLRSARLTGFMEGFSTISLRLKEMYQMITMGGNAELELVDSLDPFSEGILFSVMPPKKSWKNISNLSGGEKTLSSLALVFALHHYKPTPLYVMDEIDAALDFRNVSIVASYIKERTKNAQFIVISLRNNMFELASRLVGVYKVNHMTKSVTVENRDYITGRSSSRTAAPTQS